MNTKQIKEELRLILKDYHYNNDEQHMSKDVVTALENLLGSIVNSITNSHNECGDCGCIPKNDEWYTPRSDIFKGERYCFDCGGEAEHEFWVDYAQRKMEL